MSEVIERKVHNSLTLNRERLIAKGERLMAVALARMKDLVPTGYRFRPTDDELVRCYLQNKVEGNPLPCEIVAECELYGVKEPWEIWATFRGDAVEDEVLYVFTKLRNKTRRSSRIERRVGSGSWKGERKADRVCGRKTNICIGLKKRFHYENHRSKHHRRWLLDEYSLVPGKDPSEYVLCRLIKNGAERRRSWGSLDAMGTDNVDDVGEKLDMRTDHYNTL